MTRKEMEEALLDNIIEEEGEDSYWLEENIDHIREELNCLSLEMLQAEYDALVNGN